MIPYLIRRILAAGPILFGVNLITFVLFFSLNSPDDMARMQLGEKHITHVEIDNWKKSHGYDYPLFYNANAKGIAQFTASLFFQKSMKLFSFDFGLSDQGRDIGYDILERIFPSLMISIPIFIVGIASNIFFAGVICFFRRTRIDLVMTLTCMLLMSISSLFYIIGGQYLFSLWLGWFPISGYADGWESLQFILLPIAIGVLSGLGSGVRWYRIIFLEEMSREYVKTARAKGLSDGQVILKHILKNSLIPILTGIVVVIPSLFMGSLILESFFGIPGLGSYTIDAINQQDFSIVRAMVFLGSLLYVIGLLLTDLAYIWVDPRVRFE